MIGATSTTWLRRPFQVRDDGQRRHESPNLESQRIGETRRDGAKRAAKDGVQGEPEEAVSSVSTLPAVEDSHRTLLDSHVIRRDAPWTCVALHSPVSTVHLYNVLYPLHARYEHMPEVRRIAKHRHVPKMIKNAAEAERLQRDKERRKVTVWFGTSNLYSFDAIFPWPFAY